MRHITSSTFAFGVVLLIGVLGMSAQSYAADGVIKEPIIKDSVKDDALDSMRPRKLPPVSEGILKQDDKAVIDRSIAKAGAAAHGMSALRLALQDYREKRIDEATRRLEIAANNGSFIARFLLAHIYRTGKTGVVDHPKAFEHYRRITSDFAKNQEHYVRVIPFVAHSYVQLARYMEVGVSEIDIIPDPYLARILFEKAAHFGDVEGQYQLGRFLIETGQRRNLKLGQRWLTRAAIKNNPKAQAYLGALYWQGDMVTQKQGLALAWIQFARRNATGHIKQQVERLYEAVRYDMSEVEHRRAQTFIGRLRTKYHVLWGGEVVTRGTERDLLDGIILADPPQGLDQEQLEAMNDRNRVSDGSVDPGDNSYAAPGLGFQMFDYGSVGGR